jgi:hypothetical protein
MPHRHQTWEEAVRGQEAPHVTKPFRKKKTKQRTIRTAYVNRYPDPQVTKPFRKKKTEQRTIRTTYVNRYPDTGQRMARGPPATPTTST